MLRQLPLQYVYDTSERNIVDELFQPLLQESVLYQRGVGYFTSGWLRLNMQGIRGLVERRGKAVIVTSPHLTRDDVEAIRRGEEAKRDEGLYRSLIREVEVLEQSNDLETLTMLSWLIADDLLDMRFAIPKNDVGDFHDKFAVFTDEAGDSVAIHGSYNDSIHANYNGESFSVYCSWIEGQAPYVAIHRERFAKLVEGRNDFFRMYNMPELIRDKLVRLTQYTERPYNVTKTAVEASRAEVLKIRLPENVKLFDYQRKAIEAWRGNGDQGMFSMATGTGKTISSLAATVDVFRERRKICLIVSVPFKHLVEQWKGEVRAFGYDPIASTDRRWLLHANALVDDYNLGLEDALCFIVTHHSNADDGPGRFLRIISKIRDKDSIVFIGDEAHYLGASYLRNSLHPDVLRRIGLSATPSRWRDAEGTRVVTEYFSKEVIQYGLEKAIEEGFLTPYEFSPHYVELTEDEYAEYKRLSIRISQLLQAAKKDPGRRDAANVYAAQRANIINKSDNKISAFLDLFRAHIREYGREGMTHTIVYSPEGKHRDIVRLVANTGLRVQEIVADTSNADRQAILRAFDRGDIHVIVAMKCLDEGVNVPSTKRAYFLASTSNPRQFIQRRGRILRRTLGKTKAFIYDFVMIPPQHLAEEGQTHIQVLKREFARFLEFYLCASNAMAIHNAAYTILERYGLGFILSLQPEDIYASLQEELDDDGI